MSASRMRVLPTLERAEPDHADTCLRLAAHQDDPVSVAHVTGNSEDAPRIAAVVEALAQTGAFRQIVLSPPTDELAELGVPSAVRLPDGPTVIESIRERLEAACPAVVMVYGYDEIALAGALAAARRQVSLVRVGRAPESRELACLVDRLADLVLLHDQQDACEVERMRVPVERVRVVGNPLIDAVRWSLRDPGGQAWNGAERLERDTYFLAILTHEALPEGLGEQLAAVAATTHLVLIGTGSEQRFAAARAAGATLMPKLGFAARLAMIRNAGAILTDSDRAMEEAAAIGVRCHTLGLPHSRIRAATTVDLGDDVAAIAGLRPLSADPTPCVVPLWDGRAGTRIADVMLANFARMRMLA